MKVGGVTYEVPYRSDDVFAGINREPKQTLAEAEAMTDALEREATLCDHGTLRHCAGRATCNHCDAVVFDGYRDAGLRDELGTLHAKVQELQRENADLALALRRAERGRR